MTTYISKARDPLSSFTHFLGAIVFGTASLFLFLKSGLKGTMTLPHFFALLTFSVSITTLYSTSAYYHYYQGSSSQILNLRKWDHSMIYIFIAGTYTPILLTYLPHHKAIFFTAFMWFFASLGIIMKVFFINVPRWISSALYVLMGWMIMFDPSIFLIIPLGAIILLVLGGISYTIGGIIYAIKKPDFRPPSDSMRFSTFSFWVAAYSTTSWFLSSSHNTCDTGTFTFCHIDSCFYYIDLWYN